MAEQHSHPITQQPPPAPIPSDESDRRNWQQVWAFVILGLSGFLWLALLSYQPGNLPSWFPLEGTAEVSARSNLIGPIGAVTAATLFSLIGLAAFWVPVALTWAAVAIYFQFPIFRWRTLLALGVFLVAAACLVQFQPFLFSEWAERLGLAGKGGLAGYFVGELAVQNAIGLVGGAIVMAVINVVGLVFVVGVHPFELKAYVKQKMAERDLPPPSDEQGVVQPGPIAYYCNVPGHRCLEHCADSAEEDAESCCDETAEEAPVEVSVNSVVQEAVVLPDEEIEPHPVAEVIDVTPAEEEVEEPIEVGVAASSVQAPPQESRVTPSVEAAPSLAEVMRAREVASGVSAAAARPGTNAPANPFPQGDWDLESYEHPAIELLEEDEDDSTPLTDRAELIETHATIVDTLKTFGLDVSPGEVTCGPTITRYEIYPSRGLRVKQITALEADLALATRAKTINILAPIPGKDTVGIEIENARKTLVPLRSLLEDEEFRKGDKKIPVALGQDVYGKTIVADLAAMPHLLVAGATGSGKSVCINCIITSLLFRFKPDELRLIMIDPKVVEMQVYHSLPHLALPVVTDPRKVPLALQWVIDEMERRYQLFAEFGVRKLEEYNKRDPNKGPRPYKLRGDQMQFDYESQGVMLSDPDQEEANAFTTPVPAEDGEESEAEQAPEQLPYVVVIIDELADLMQTAAADVEAAINRLCQKARAAGIHLIVATQSPRVDVVTGLIKANIPARIAFQVASNADSRVILDKSGAEKLVGKGDMLYQPPDSPIMVRAQGAFLADEEVHDIVEHCSGQALPQFDPAVEASLSGAHGAHQESETLSQADEETLQRCIDAIRSDRKASASYLQRRLRIGYVRAARMMDLLEERGIVGPADGAKPRDIYLPPE